ncbi:TetR/AcrR family transcriptional regulator, partial [Mycobacterium sp.]|uniref:TetR/AcrR family transcriptional regulator n=1 Tax=Mycobacterium sp. TaxID=1785 RepID=UPI00333E98CF
MPDEHDLMRRPGAAKTTETKTMKPTQRESYHHGDLRKALLEAALELVWQRRSTHFSLRDLAERVGVTQSAIYRHFNDLDDLLSTLCRQGFDALAETERQILVDSPDPSVRLRALIRLYIQFATSNPAYFRIMFDSGFANRPENIGRARPTFKYLKDVIAEIGGGHDGAFEKTVAIWASLHGLSALMLSGQLGPVLKQPARRARLEQTVTEL